MYDYKVLSDILDRLGALSERVTRLETFEQPRYGLLLYKTSTQVVIDAAAQEITFEQVYWKNGTYSVPNFFTAPVAARYLFQTRLGFSVTPSNIFTISIASTTNTKNRQLDFVYPVATGPDFGFASVVLNLAKGENVHVVAAASGGTTATVSPSTAAFPYHSYFMATIL